MGIPAAAVVDLDLITNSEQRLLYRAAGVPDGLVKTFGQWTGEVRAAFEQLGVQPKQAGINALKPADRDVASTLLEALEQYGVFVVNVGEVENWLATLGVTGQKREWLGRVIEAMGTDPAAADYLQPQRSDVWEFLRRIARWTSSDSRKGMPE